MAKPDARNIRFDEMNPKNIKWFESFKLSTSYSTAYYQSIENFLKYKELSDKPLSSFATSDVEKYRNAMWEYGITPIRTDSIIAGISTFKNYLINIFSFPEDFLSGINNLKVNERASSDSTALTLEQLKYIREFNEKNFLYEYLFEILFQLGIDKKDLINCLPLYAKKELRVFTKGEINIRYNNKISELLRRDYDNKELKRVITNIDYLYFKKLTDYLRDVKNIYTKQSPRQINYSDILKTHEIYIIKCPNPDCNELVENLSTNWVLVQTEFEKEYRLFCNICKGRYYEHSQDDRQN